MAEPFGWNIGIKTDTKWGAKQKEEKRLAEMRSLKLKNYTSKNLKEGMDQLMHNTHYRTLYQTFKKRQTKYNSELARILNED